MKATLFPLPKARKPKLERLREEYADAIGEGPNNKRRSRREIVEAALNRLRKAELAEIRRRKTE